MNEFGREISMQEPLIYTTRGNIPVSWLQVRQVWEVTEDRIVFAEEYFLGEELVKRPVHVYLKRGLLAEGQVATIG